MMSIAIMALLSWLAIIAFATVPKGLTLSEMVFLYFLIGILTISLFTILDVNLHWVPVTREVEGSFAMYICRFILIPLQVLLSVCVLQSRLKAKWKWVLSGIILLGLVLEDRFYLSASLIEFRKWNELYSILMYGAFILLIWQIARWFVSLDRGGFK